MNRICKSLVIAAAGLAMSSPAFAFYTECRVWEETPLSRRPDGPIEPRMLPIEKGDRVNIRDSFEGWVYIVHYNQEPHGSYGWLPRTALGRCRQMDGTP